MNNILRNSLLGTLALTTISGAVAQSKTTSEKAKKNILVLFVDDLGWGDVNYRNLKFDTPNINRLNSESLCFDRAYCGQPASSPSRGSLHTGRNPVRFQMVRHIENTEYQKEGKEPEFSLRNCGIDSMPSRNWLPLEEITYAERLKDFGYNTAFVGKWHLGSEEYWPNHQGYDDTFGVSDFGNVSSYYAPYFRFKKGGDTTKGVEKGTFITDMLTEHTVNYIKNYDKKEPFLLSMFYYNVHTPNSGRLDLVEKYKNLGYNTVDANYAAQVEAVDQSIGDIYKALKDKGILDNTVIVFYSDQGGYFSNRPLRGCKKIEDTMAEGGIRVPLSIYYPGLTNKGERCETPVQSIDIYPTLVEIASGKKCTDKQVNGVSLMPLLQGKKLADRNLYFFRAYDIDQYAALIRGDWKIIKWHNGYYQMYNLKYDQGETTNLVNVETARFEKMKKDLHNWEVEAIPTYKNDYRKRLKY